tara:strand:- start:2927 stop:3121 length:195 start_codon:yes stop_codon:yes gene_type:complete
MNLKDILKQFEDRIIQLEQDNNELFDRIIELEDELYGEEDNGIEDQEETEEGEAQVTYRIIGGD